LLALTIGVVVNSKILYNFLLSAEESYKSYSPTILLLKGVYEYCQGNSYKLYDLGPASDEGIPNYGLITFKQKTGGEASLKMGFEKFFHDLS
jgi:lipid II:glycine glycyltransferase (peptidoglycan interpeptide bridge formation enzyme)